MQDFTLLRTGLPSLKFTGELLASAESNEREGPPGLGWEIDFYRTRGGAYVVSVIRRTQWQGQDDHFEAQNFHDNDALATVLRSHNPLTRIDLSEDQARAARFLSQARNAFDAVVTRLYSDLGEQFVEVIE